MTSLQRTINRLLALEIGETQTHYHTEGKPICSITCVDDGTLQVDFHKYDGTVYESQLFNDVDLVAAYTFIKVREQLINPNVDVLN